MKWILLFAMSLVGVHLQGVAPAAADQDRYPRRPIKLIVPFSPGGGTDTFARFIKKSIEDNDLLPQPLVIINVDGAGATIGSRRVKNARPDGYTLLLLHEAIVTAKYSGKASYGPEAFEPIAGTGRVGLVFAVGDNSPYHTLDDLMKVAVEKPDTLVFAANLGAPAHFVGLRLESAFPGARFRFTQSGGGTKRLHAIKGGHGDVSAFSIEEYLRFRPAGLRAIAYCDEDRHPALPDVPTTHEQGVDLTHVNMQFWWAPKGTPKSCIEVLASALEKAMKTEYMQAQMARIKSEPIFVRGEAMQREIELRRASFSRIDLRDTEALPNVPAMVIPSVAVLLAVVLIRSRRSLVDSQSPRKASAPRIRSALICAALTIAYVLSLSLSVLGFRASTLLYVLATGGLLVHWQPRRLVPVAFLAIGLSFGVHILFTRVFDLVMP